MIDTLGGPNKVNNMLAALNIPTISNSKLKKMERRAGSNIEKVASESVEAAGKEAFQREMEDIAVCESLEAEKSINILIKELGVSVLPEASPMKEELIISDRSSYKQGDLVQDILGIQYNAHDALEDVRALVKLFQHCCALVNDLLKFTFSLNAVYHQCLSSKEKAKNLPSLSCLIARSVCKLPTAENIASSGLNLEHLRKIFIRDGEDGLHSTFTMKNSEGQPRVTNTKRTLETVIPKLADFLQKNTKNLFY